MIYQLYKVTREVYTRGLTIYLLKDWGLGPLLPRENCVLRTEMARRYPHLGYAIGDEVQNLLGVRVGHDPSNWPRGWLRHPAGPEVSPDPLPKVDTSVEIVNVKADSKQFSFETTAPAYLLLDIKKWYTLHARERSPEEKKSDSEIIRKRRKDSWLLLLEPNELNKQCLLQEVCLYLWLQTWWRRSSKFVLLLLWRKFNSYPH